MSDREQQGGSKRRESLICHLILVILSLALLWPVVRDPGRWIWAPGANHSDLAVTHWPNAHFTRRALWEEGEFPLWRPTLMSGAPFAASPLAGLCYAPNWPLLFAPWLPLEAGFNLSALMHLWLAGAAMYALMRRGLGVGIWGALAAAVAYEASPKLAGHLGAGHLGWVQAWGWVPAVVLCWLQLCRARGWRLWNWAAGGGVALGMQFTADVRMVAYTLAAAAALALARVLAGMGGEAGGQGDSDDGIRRWPFFVFALIVFVGMCACQWFPAVAVLPETTRASMTLDDAAVWSLPWRYLVGLVLADHGGFHEWMTYVGVSTFVLACVGAWSLWRDRGRRWIALWLVGLGVFAAWFSLGENGGLFQVLWRAVPGLGLLRVPPRAWVLVAFAAAVLAGLGLEETERRGGRRWRMTGLAVGALPPFFVAGYWLLVGPPPLNLVMSGVVTPLAVALVGLRSWLSPSQVEAGRRPRLVTPRAVLALAAVLLIGVDLLVADRTLVEARSWDEVFADGRAAAEWLAARPGNWRVYSPSYSIPQHVAELYGLRLADGVDPLQLRVYADYLTRAAGLEPGAYSVTLPPFPEGADVRTALQDAVPNAQMLGLLGVRYAASSFPIVGRGWEPVGQFEGVYVYENRRAGRPREASGAGSIVLADGTTLFRYDPRPVYAGWAVSGLTVVGLLAGLLATRLGRRGTSV